VREEENWSEGRSVSVGDNCSVFPVILLVKC